MLLKMMTMFGLYHRPTDKVKTEESPALHGRHCNVRFIWSTFILVCLWLNFIRFLLVFAQNEPFDSLLVSKISFCAIFLECSMSNTSYYIAMRTGRLDRIINTMRISVEFAERLRKLSIVFVVLTTCLAMLLTVIVSAALYYFGESFIFLAAPFENQVLNSDSWFEVTKIGFVVLCILLVQSWSLPMAMNTALTFIFYWQFCSLNERFASTLGRNGKLASGDLATFRSRHQALSRPLNYKFDSHEGPEYSVLSPGPQSYNREMFSSWPMYLV